MFGLDKIPGDLKDALKESISQLSDEEQKVLTSAANLLEGVLQRTISRLLRVKIHISFYEDQGPEPPA